MSNKEIRAKLFNVSQKLANETGAKIFLSEAPQDPEEKEKWVEQMTRIQIAIYVDEGASCAHCGHKYKSVDDFLEKKVKDGYPPDKCVCCECWGDYAAKHS